MNMFLGNEEVWDELMLQEGRHDELGLNGTENATNVTEMLEEAAGCVGAACAAAMGDDIAASLHDEF